MSDTPRTDAGARHVSVDRAGCITLWHSKNGGYVERALSEQLERENAALREAINDIDAEIEGNTTNWVKVSRIYCIVRDLKRKEAKP